jgi:hypothetical protein
MFYYKPFYEYKESFLLSKDNNQSVEQAFYWKQVITFLISKNRWGVDGIEKPFQIDFDKGICYSAVPADKLMSWKF